MFGGPFFLLGVEMAVTAERLLSSEIGAEIARFAEEIERLDSGEADPDDFRRFRLENGVYGIRGTTDRHMVRIKLPFGNIGPYQLETIADLAEEFTPTGIAHITTRQDIQLHNVRRSDLVTLLHRLAEAGMTTREACGNTVRNVTACPFAGVSTSEPFDVTPYADAVAHYFLRNPINQNLPRKFKIAFEGCAEDHARTGIHDVGAVAQIRVRDGIEERGFRLYIAGGLGAQPRSATLLEDFTPADQLIPTIEAIIRVFDRHGDRRPERIHRMRSRMKFLAREWGVEKLRTVIFVERRAVLATRSGSSLRSIDTTGEPEPFVASRFVKLPHSLNAEYQEWLRTNVTKQKQAGWNVVTLRCPLGDLTATDLRNVAQLAREACDGRIRLAITQNLLLRWVPDAVLPFVFSELQRVGLSHGNADRIVDITRCPGADTCQLALTRSKALAAALDEVLGSEFAGIPEVQDLTIKISGCMNSCGQHHIADIGFHGATEVAADGRPVPVYVMMAGGSTVPGTATFGKIVGRIPARAVPDALCTLLMFFLDHRRSGENFHSFLMRVGVNAVKEVIRIHTLVPGRSLPAEMYFDLGSTDEVYTAEVGVGECAS
jgi:sulfite reductase (ferredoxin)